MNKNFLQNSLKFCTFNGKFCGIGLKSTVLRQCSVWSTILVSLFTSCHVLMKSINAESKPATESWVENFSFSTWIGWKISIFVPCFSIPNGKYFFKGCTTANSTYLFSRSKRLRFNAFAGRSISDSLGMKLKFLSVILQGHIPNLSNTSGGDIGFFDITDTMHIFFTMQKGSASRESVQKLRSKKSVSSSLLNLRVVFTG